MNTPTLPALLASNPRLDQWVGFPAPGCVTVSTGRVEIGQGVLTAMLQIAAEELDVAPERILLQTGDTDLTPNEGYTAGSQSIQFGGVALRMACAEVRALFLDHAAASLGYSRANLAVRDGAITHRGETTGHDYWSLATAVDLRRDATGRPPTKSVRDYNVVGQNAPRVDLAAKVFGGPAFVHDMVLDGMVHARVVRQPRRGATIGKIDEAALRRAAKGPIEIVRHGNFLAILGAEETVVEAVAAVAANHGCCSNRRSIARSARLRPPSRHRRQPGTRQPTPGCTSPMPRWHLPAGSHNTGTGGSRCGPIRRGSTRCATRWRGH